MIAAREVEKPPILGGVLALSIRAIETMRSERALSEGETPTRIRIHPQLLSLLLSETGAHPASKVDTSDHMVVYGLHVIQDETFFGFEVE